MANKKVSIKDRQTVVKRLVQGASYREAMEGTSIKSTQTVGAIAKLKSNEIKQTREDYLSKIEQFEAGLIDRAKLWADMTKATKIQNNKEIPDWSNRREALVYIDQMAGLSKDNLGINLIQINLSPEIQELAQ